ncbi:hypothetical protein [Aquisphaera insulae]|uniref:hypothetical protein n=1 Tax=Aquisphaera insulae TaxID=2712864 RepID=UPI0013EC6D74|nr:hypothetical protein [Aquisphaera insulae]
MLELPFLDKFKEEWKREAAHKATHENQVRNIVDVLTARFGARASSLRSKLAAIDDEETLGRLVKVAAVCESLKDFRTHLRDQADKIGKS